MRALLPLLLLILSSSINAQTTLTRSFVHGSITREYKIYIPASYNSSTPAPLVLNLHGYGSDMGQQEAYGDFRPIADTAGFIIVHPNGTFDTSFKRFWNAYGATTVDDLGFLSALIDTVKTDYTIDANRVFSTGLSNGAIMSYYLACNLSSEIAAIASVAGSMTPVMENSCNSSHPTPVMEIHGTADAVVPYAGSSLFLHIDTIINRWRSFNNCTITPVITNVTDINTTDGCTATRYDYNGGTAGSKVALYKINNGGHSWPGAPVNIAVTNHDFSASKEIWKFFRQFRLNVLSDVKHETQKDFSVYPNPATDFIELSIVSEGRIAIYDMTGKMIKTENIKEGSHRITITELKSGIYFLKLVTKESEQVKRIVKF